MKLRSFPTLAWLLLMTAGAQAQIPAGVPPEEVDRIPFARWVAEGDRAQIPWKVRVHPARMRFDQRLLVEFEAAIRAKDMIKRGGLHDLSLVARVADSRGEWLEGYGALQTELDPVKTPRATLVFRVQAWMRPGEYAAGLVMTERRTGARNVARREFRVPAVSRDPLPELYRDLPRAEFLPAAEGADTFFRSEITSRLWLPAPTQEPVHVELLMNFSTTEELTGRRWAHRYTLRTMLEALRLLTQISLPNGTLRITGLDLVERRVVFEQEKVKEVDWPRLRAALGTMNPGMIGARALAGRKQNAAFFRDVLARRLRGETLTAASGDQEGAANLSAGSGNGRTSGDNPPRGQRVFIVVSNAMMFPKGADRKPLRPEGDCRCRIYFLRFEFGSGWMWDELFQLLKPLRPQRFDIIYPTDARKAVAEILKEMRQM